MTLIEPKIDELLEESNNDPFLLCSVASHRANDINDMLCGQRKRAKDKDAEVFDQILASDVKKPLSIAFDEIDHEDVSYDPNTIDLSED